MAGNIKQENTECKHFYSNPTNKSIMHVKLTTDSNIKKGIGGKILKYFLFRRCTIKHLESDEYITYARNFSI